MPNKKHIVLFFIVALMALMTSAVSASTLTASQPNDPAGPNERPDRPRLGGELLQIVLEQTGLRMQELREQMGEDGILADVITANGGDVQAVIDAAVAQATERINTAVENERITQEQADERLAELTERLTERINSPRPEREDRPDRGDRASDLLDGVIRDYLDDAGITVEIIREGRQAGQTLAETLTANGVDVDDFISTVSAQVESVLSEAVANERITQERADELLENFTERLTERINKTPPAPRGEV
jgi:uncharacterized coiled-coil protein SlyX